MQKTPDDLTVFFIVSTLLLAFMAMFIISLLFLYRKRQMAFLTETSKLKEEYEKNLLQAQLEIQENTLEQISKEIHDNVNLGLTLAKLQLNTIDIKRSDQGILEKQVFACLQNISQAIEDLNDISHSMNPELVIEEGLLNALENEMAKLRKIGLHEVVLTIKGNPVFMSSNKELIVFRILQECIQNVLKHAQADKIQVVLHYEDHNLAINFKDNGRGFKQDENMNGTHMGLINMQKRITLLNGSCYIQSSPGTGTIINITIPFNTNENFG